MLTMIDCTDSTKRMLMGDMLTKYYKTNPENRDPNISEALKSVEDDDYFDILYDIYGRGWTIGKTSLNNFCSETSCKKYRARMLDAMIKYLNI